MDQRFCLTICIIFVLWCVCGCIVNDSNLYECDLVLIWLVFIVYRVN